MTSDEIRDRLHQLRAIPLESVLVATANPFNKQAAADLEVVMKHRLLMYLACTLAKTNPRIAPPMTPERNTSTAKT